MDSQALTAWAGAYGLWVVMAAFGLVALAETRVGARPRRGDPAARQATNCALGAMAFGVAWLVPVGLTGLAALGHDRGWGWGAVRDLPLAWQLVLALLVRSLVGYWAHRLSHRLPWLWRLHRVHHSDTAIDATTGFRHHPLEQFVSFAFALPAIWLFGLPPAAVAVAEIILLVAGIAEHANIRTDGAFWRRAAWLFATPAVHLVHHSSRQAQTDSNYGTPFTLWDRLFGTWRDPDAERVETIGLGPAYDADADRCDRQLLLPFARETRAPGPR